MSVTYLTLVILFAREVKYVHGPTPDVGDLNLTRLSSSDWNHQSLSVLQSNPCDAITIRSAAPNANLACHHECIALNAEIRDIHTRFPYYQTTQYLLTKCGMVTEGKCGTGAEALICWCHTGRESKDLKRNTLFNCRGGIQLVKKFTDAVTATMEAVHMQNVPPARSGGIPPPVAGTVPRHARSDRPHRTNSGLLASCCGLGNKRTASPDSDDDTSWPTSGSSRGGAGPSEAGPSKKQKRVSSPSSGSSDAEDKCLYTNVTIEGEVVQVVVDTGAAMCIIPPKYSRNVAHDGTKIYSYGEQHSFQVSGKTTIKITVGTGVAIPVTGFVADRNSELILGNDFFEAWAAKINIAEGTMQLSTGLSDVVLGIEFLNSPADIEKMSLHTRRYTSLLIPARLNGVETRACIDTGASTTSVNKNIVLTNFRNTNSQVSFGGSAPTGWLGKANVNFSIGSNNLDIRAFVPTFVPDVDLLLGNDFISQYVQLINYEEKKVYLKFPRRNGYSLIIAQMFVMEDE